MKKITRTAAAAFVSFGLVGTFALPAYATSVSADEQFESKSTQTMVTANAPKAMLQADVLKTTEDPDILAVERRQAREDQRREDLAEVSQNEAESEALRNTLAEEEAAASDTAQSSYANVPQGEGAAGLVAAARAQFGVGQDCTMLVENSLRAIGYQVGNLAPMGFGQFGTAINPADAKPGDILMRGSHVAIYTGDGNNHSAVHGGWQGGTTAESPWEASPYDYEVVIRLR